jgi:hypothetical protein
MLPQSPPLDERNHWRIFFASAGIIIGLWLLALWVVQILYGFPSNAGEFGDLFGSVNALFSGLAFAAIVVTLRVQMLELRQNTSELQNQANALQRQADLMRLSAKLSALPILIEQKKMHVQTLAPTLCRDFAKGTYSVVDIEMKVAQTSNQLANCKMKLQVIHQDLGHWPEQMPLSSYTTAQETLRNEKIEFEQLLIEAECAIPALHELKILTEQLDSTFAQFSN